MSSKRALKLFRKAISDAWLPRVGRRRLSSAEYVLTEEWFNSHTSIDLIIRAIHICADRAQRNGSTIYSLGVIKADLETLKRQQSRSHVGAHLTSTDWQQQWEFDLREIRETISDPASQALYDQLIDDLPNLTELQARERFRKLPKEGL